MLNILPAKQARIYTTDISKRHYGIQTLFLDPKKNRKRTHTHFVWGGATASKTLLYNYISSKKGHLQEKGEAPPAARPREVSVEWPGGALAQKVGKSLKEDQEVSKIYQL